MEVVVYIGLSNDPTFKWVGGDYNGNRPEPISPDFPGVRRLSNDLHPGHRCSYANTSWHQACRDFGLQLVQLDWGAFGTKISKSQILALLARFGSTKELNTCIQNLDDNTEYALVIAETGWSIEDEYDL